MLDWNLPLSLCTDSLCFLLLVSNVLGFPYAFFQGSQNSCITQESFLQRKFMKLYNLSWKAWKGLNCLYKEWLFGIHDWNLVRNAEWELTDPGQHHSVSQSKDTCWNGCELFFFSISNLWKTEIPLEFRGINDILISIIHIYHWDGRLVHSESKDRQLESWLNYVRFWG